MTVVLVTNSDWNIVNFRHHLVQDLHASGHRVVLVTPAGNHAEALARLPAEVVYLRHLRRGGLNPLRDLFLLGELTGIIRRHQVRAILNFTVKPVIYGSLAARLTGAKNISTLTGLGYTFIAGGKIRWLISRFYRIALRRAERVFFHNPDDQALFVDQGLVRAEQAAVVGGSGVDPAAFPLADYAEAVPGTFLFVGRLLVDKGIREFIAAARYAKRQEPDLQFHVAGSVDPANPASITEAELQSWIDEGLIVYHGQVADVRPLYRAASVVVLPSYREGCPRALLEAAATGRPLIAFDVPGCREVVLDGQTGWLVTTRNVKALAARMLEANTMATNQLASLGKNGRALVERRFSVARVNNVYLASLQGFPTG